MPHGVLIIFVKLLIESAGSNEDVLLVSLLRKGSLTEKMEMIFPRHAYEHTSHGVTHATKPRTSRLLESTEGCTRSEQRVLEIGPKESTDGVAYEAFQH